MKIATLQFSPRVGEVGANFSQAEALLMRAEHEGDLDGLDMLVLPEMAFSGYNHPSLQAISPYLEPTAAGPSTRWASRTAKRLGCTVAVGYPEDASSETSGNFNTVYDQKIMDDVSAKTVAYNSLVFVDSQGEIVAHYRKSFLYYTDQTWAQEGPAGFYHGVVPIGNADEKIKIAAGICMDINPYQFEAPWTAYEFATHCHSVQAQVVVVSMAWLTRLSHEEVFGMVGGSNVDVPSTPDMDTIGYWIERFRPLLTAAGADREVVVVLANRAGEEGQADIVGEVRYAGSSSVMGMRKAGSEGETNVRIWDMLGRGVDGLLVVDTSQPAKYEVQRKAASVETE